MGQADPILTKLNAGPAVKKLVETALVLSNSQDPQQRNHAYSFMESAIKELEDDEKLHEEEMGMHSGEDGLNNTKIGEQEDDDDDKKLHEEEDDKEHKIHEEELSNHNQGGRTTGSEQSTDNTEPYPGEGKDTTTGEKPMQDMDGTVNQWNETGGMPPPGAPPGMPPGVPPGMQPGMNGMGETPNGGGMIVPGLAPDIAQEMGLGMPQPPPMDTNQMMRQMQYTAQAVMKDYDTRVILPMRQYMKKQSETIKNQRETQIKQKDVIQKLSREIQETKTNSGSLKLDLDSIKKNANAHFRETVPTPQNYQSNEMDNVRSIVQPVPNQKRFKVEAARSEIEQMDRILNSNKNPMYN